MNQDLLRQVAAELNHAPEAGARVARMAAAVDDNNARIGTAALRELPFDSSPYGFPDWLAGLDKA